MAALDGVDITAALVGSITSHVEEHGKQSLQKWKQQVKIMTTRITVVRRFTRTYRAKSFLCDISPGSTAASPQKSNTSEGSRARNFSSGALFGPNTAVQDAPKQKVNSEKKNAQGYSFMMDDVFKDHCTLSPLQILVTVLNFQILKEAELLVRRIIVTVIGLDSKEEGTMATYNHVVRTALRGLILLLCLGNFAKGVNAQSDSEIGKLEFPSERTGDLPYKVQLAAWTFVAGIFMMAVISIAGRVNRRPVVAAPPAVPVPAIPIGAAVPQAVPAPAIPIGAAVPQAVPAPAIPIGAAVPQAVPAPAIPIVAAVPQAVPAPAIPIGVAVPQAVPAPAIPIGAAVPQAVPAPAIPIGFFDVMIGLEDPNPARISNLDFHIHNPLRSP